MTSVDWGAAQLTFTYAVPVHTPASVAETDSCDSNETSTLTDSRGIQRKNIRLDMADLVVRMSKITFASGFVPVHSQRIVQ